MKAALEENIPEVEIELIESSGGAFEIRRDGDLVYSKLETGEFPSNELIVKKLNG